MELGTIHEMMPRPIRKVPSTAAVAQSDMPNRADSVAAQHARKQQYRRYSAGPPAAPPNVIDHGHWENIELTAHGVLHRRRPQSAVEARLTKDEATCAFTSQSGHRYVRACRKKPTHKLQVLGDTIGRGRHAKVMRSLDITNGSIVAVKHVRIDESDTQSCWVGIG